MSMARGLLARRFAAGFVDWTIEFSGGLLGSYFGALVAALVIAVQGAPAEQMQSSMWNGFGFGFVFWTLSVSFLNRVLIQGVSRSSIGKKMFKLELIATQSSLTWTRVMKRWVLSFASFALCGAGYIYAIFSKEGSTFHDLAAHTDVIPLFEGRSMSFEHREDVPMTIHQIRELLVLSPAHSERPVAQIVPLPVRTFKEATGTDGHFAAPVHSLGNVVELKKSGVVQTKLDETERKKAA